MEEVEIIYYFITLLMALLIFDLKISGVNEIFRFVLQALAKLSSLFVMGYAVLKIFKYYNFL